MSSDMYTKTYGKALKTAAKWHRDHARKQTTTPYITHLLTVSALVWEGGGNETEAIAALLHDAVEDRKATLGDVRDKFGDEVATIVDHCSDAAPAPGEAKEPWLARKVAHVDKLRKIAADGGDSTIRVVGADKLANLRTILVDHRGGAADIWGRFKGGLGGSAWYYGEMAATVESTLPDSMLARELRLAVDDLDALMADTTAGLDGLDHRLASALGDTAKIGAHDATRFLALELARVANGHADDLQGHLCLALSKFAGPKAMENPADLGALRSAFDAVVEATTPNAPPR